MPANYTHTTVGAGSTLTASKWNGDHENHTTNRSSTTIQGTGSNVTELRAVYDVGDVNSEILPTNFAEDIQAIRDQILHAKETTYWYETLTTGRLWARITNVSASASVICGLPPTGSTHYRWIFTMPPDYAGGDITLTYFMAQIVTTGSAVADLRSHNDETLAETDLDNQNTPAGSTVFVGAVLVDEADLPAVGSSFSGALLRYADDASDTAPGYITLLGVRMSYTAYAGGPKR